jgi:NAD(P)-dependent dehydrogenase (short-subunit alcohol dehydrogenase family)
VRNAIDLFRLDGKIALVTGGTGLYGRHIVRALAEAGATVIVASRDAKRCRQYAKDLSSDGLRADGDRYDQGSERSIRALRDRILKRHGKLDVLFNNSVSRAGGDLRQATSTTWRRAMKVNSTGLLLACQIFSEPMQEQGSGSIVNIASIYGMAGPDWSIYKGTAITNPIDYHFAKGGMIQMTRYLASYLGPYNIRVNALSPGGLETPDHSKRFVKQYSARTLLGRMADDDDIKGPAVFLASDASQYITGANIPVDAGWTAI